MTEDEKPVWKMNTGNGVPRDLGDELIFSNGLFDATLVCSWHRTDARRWSISAIDNKVQTIYAYQTNRTKKAKISSTRKIEDLLRVNITTNEFKEHVYDLFGDKIDKLCPLFITNQHPFNEHSYLSYVMHACILMEIDDIKKSLYRISNEKK